MLGGVGLPELLQLVTLVVSRHGGIARVPRLRTDLSVHVRVLEGLHQSQVLRNVPADWQVINGNMPQNPLGVDDEGPTKVDTVVTRVIKVDSVLLADFLGEVGDHGDLHRSQTA